MARLCVLFLIAILGITALTCNATTYMVGDSSGWDISTDIDTWALDKQFTVGDVLVFQYSSSHSVSEVTRKSYENCNTTNVLKTYSNGNTTVPLTRSGEMYFLCGNKLHCLGGMKLQINVEGEASEPAGAPEAQPGANNLPRPSSKSDNPSAIFPTSQGFVYGGRESFVMALLGFVVTLIWINEQI